MESSLVNVNRVDIGLMHQDVSHELAEVLLLLPQSRLPQRFSDILGLRFSVCRSMLKVNLSNQPG
jgi:hypothetical protein